MVRESPPPPPVGREVTTADGYDQEDLDTLAMVGDYHFGSILARLPIDSISLPEHPLTKVDEATFLALLRSSISLTAEEKYRILAAVPRLSQFQIDELMKIFREEAEKFRALSTMHLPQLRAIEERTALGWRMIVDCYGSYATSQLQFA